MLLKYLVLNKMEKAIFFDVWTQDKPGKKGDQIW